MCACVFTVSTLTLTLFQSGREDKCGVSPVQIWVRANGGLSATFSPMLNRHTPLEHLTDINACSAAERLPRFRTQARFAHSTKVSGACSALNRHGRTAVPPYQTL